MFGPVWRANAKEHSPTILKSKLMFEDRTMIPSTPDYFEQDKGKTVFPINGGDDDFQWDYAEGITWLGTNDFLIGREIFENP